MINKETVCKEIKAAKDWRMTPENVMTLAALIYVNERMTEENPSNQETCELTPEEAVSWVDSMENVNGTTGPSFSMEETEKYRGMCGTKPGFWAAMNMMKSDYSDVAKAFGVDRPEFYAELAGAFLKDKDAAPGKLCRYYRYIAGGGRNE